MITGESEVQVTFSNQVHRAALFERTGDLQSAAEAWKNALRLACDGDDTTWAKHRVLFCLKWNERYRDR